MRDCITYPKFEQVIEELGPTISMTRLTDTIFAIVYNDTAVLIWQLMIAATQEASMVCGMS